MLWVYQLLAIVYLWIKIFKKSLQWRNDLRNISNVYLLNRQIKLYNWRTQEILKK